ncbi:MAG: tetratricopeptide repeat protein [Bacteroidota bacterium]
MTKQILFFIGITFSITFSSCTQTTHEDYLRRGDLLYKQELYEKAVEQYDLAIKEKNDFVPAYINKGQALEFQRKFQEALDNYNQLLKVIPNQTEALTRRGITYVKIQKFQESVTDLEQANKQNPNNPLILCNLGLAKITLKDTSGIKDLDKSISMDSTNSSAFYNRGLGKLLIQESVAAIKDFEYAVKLKPDFGEAYFSIGLCKFQLGDKDSACMYWKLAVEKGYKNEKAKIIIEQNCN